MADDRAKEAYTSASDRKPWVAPKLRAMSAGSAENAVTPLDDNGVNFS